MPPAGAAQIGPDPIAATVAALGLGSGERLVARDVVKDPDGTEFLRYDRTFAGLPVVGGDLIVRRDRNSISQVSYNRGATSVGVASTKPTLPESAALAKGAQSAGFKVTANRGKLVVYVTPAKPVLAYDVVTTGVKADQTPSVLHSYIDAKTGALLASDDEIKAGTGNSMYSGTVTIGTSGTPGNYLMSDPTRGGNYTTDAGGGSGNGSTFTDADDVWGNGATSNRQTAGVDAHFGAQLTWDYYKFVHGRNGIFNNGQGARSRVHYGNGYVNAFWDGTQMTYGDGAGNARPLTSIDVAGHEMSHGVTQATANLNYSGDAGGLNESTSDIFGTMVEFSANNTSDPGDYLIGEKININGNGTPLRYMDKPSRDGASVDCWSTSTGGLDPHYSSGPLNHWFYLASEGTGSKVIGGVTHTSTACNGATLTGIGRDVVAKVWYRTLTTKLSSGSTYPDARNGAITSARELYGAGSAQCRGIEAAFTAISVPAGTAVCGNPPAGGDLYTVIASGSGSGKTEVHSLTRASNFATFGIHAATALGASNQTTTTFETSDYNADGRPDLWVIFNGNTGSGRTEVHILDAATNFTTFLVHAATPLPLVSKTRWAFAVGDYNGDGRPDLYAVDSQDTNTNTTSLHVVNGNGFAGYLNQSGTGLHRTDLALWSFQTGDFDGNGRDDLYAVNTQDAGSGKTAYHVLNATNLQQFLIHAATPTAFTSLTRWAFSTGDYNADGRDDLYLVDTQAGASTAVQIVNATNPAQYLFNGATGLHPIPLTSWQVSTS
nr:M4 family metallopeptidase [Streptomyces sp. SID13031]